MAKPSRPKKNFNPDDLTIGDRILANLHHGHAEEATHSNHPGGWRQKVSDRLWARSDGID